MCIGEEYSDGVVGGGVEGLCKFTNVFCKYLELLRYFIRDLWTHS